MMAPQIKEAASELSNRVRVAKMDSEGRDKEPEVASELRVQGLPTLILFKNGAEVTRIEGALMKNQIVQWVEENI